MSTPSQDWGCRPMVERGVNDQTARNSVSVVMISGSVCPDLALSPWMWK